MAWEVSECLADHECCVEPAASPNRGSTAAASAFGAKPSALMQVIILFLEILILDLLLGLASEGWTTGH